MRRPWFETPAVKGAVIACAAGALYWAYLAFEKHLKRHVVPPLPFRLLRQMAEDALPPTDRVPNMAASFWIQESSDLSVSAMSDDGSTHEGRFIAPSVRYEIIDARGLRYPLVEERSVLSSLPWAMEGATRLSIPWGYQQAPEKPILHVRAGGVEMWRTPVRSLPAPVRRLPPSVKDDPRLTAILTHSNGNPATLRVQVSRHLAPGDFAEIALLDTTYAAYVPPVLGTSFPIPAEYESAVHEARVRVKIFRQTQGQEEVRIHGVSLQLSYGSPVAVVEKRIVVPYDGGAARFVLEPQGRFLRRRPRKIYPAIQIDASPPGFVWLGPDPADLGLEQIRFAWQTIHAKHPPGPIRAGLIDPIRLHLSFYKRIPIEEFTVTVPVHR